MDHNGTCTDKETLTPCVSVYSFTGKKKKMLYTKIGTKGFMSIYFSGRRKRDGGRGKHCVWDGHNFIGSTTSLLGPLRGYGFRVNLVIFVHP